MNLKRIQAAFILSILLIAGHLVAYSRAASAKLTDVIKRSDLITMGSVSGITAVNGYRVATLRIEAVLKGNTAIREVRFLASPTWTCDISDAQPGERGLYFLSLPNKETEFPSQYNGQPIYLIQHSGYGRMLTVGEGKFRLTSLIDLPEAFPKEEGRSENNERFTLIATKDVVRLIRQVNTTQK
ncbi:MAG: hypothetical protein ABI977_09865 [Acidobacteriota bacterium]